MTEPEAPSLIFPRLLIQWLEQRAATYDEIAATALKKTRGNLLRAWHADNAATRANECRRIADLLALQIGEKR